MPTLYSNKEQNKRKTWIIITLFLLLVIAAGWLLSYVFDSLWILVVAVIFSITMSVGSYWWSDKLALKMSGAHPISKEDAPELYRIVENLSITAGLPMPRIYIIDDPAPNAFATGRDPEHAVVAVTRGLLERLERVEIEGVLAHELSHIQNRDMLVSTVVVVLAGIIILASEIFLRWSLFGGLRGRDNNGGGQAHAILMIVGLAAAILAPLLATTLRLAVSRKREYLADSSGALLTRYPEGLARALERIAQNPRQVKHAHNATAHLYFENPFRGKAAKNWFTRLFMTHPPVEQRVEALRRMV